MKPIYYHVLNSGIAGGLVFLGSLTPLLVGEFDVKGFFLGASVGLIAGCIIFLNKFNEWVITQCPAEKIRVLQFL